LSLFTLFNSRSDEGSAFVGVFVNKWLWAAIAQSVLLQVVVVYTPVVQAAFSTVGLHPRDWIVCAAVGSSVLWLRELVKGVARAAKAGARAR